MDNVVVTLTALPVRDIQFVTVGLFRKKEILLDFCCEVIVGVAYRRARIHFYFAPPYRNNALKAFGKYSAFSVDRKLFSMHDSHIIPASIPVYFAPLVC